MDKRTIKIIYLVVLTVECYFCYIWLIKPVAPVVLALMKGTYDLEPFTIVSGATSNICTINCRNNKIIQTSICLIT